MHYLCIYLRPKPGRTGITLQGRQQYYQTGRFPAITTAMAVKIAGHVVEVRANKYPSVLLDGQAPSNNASDLGSGASLTLGTNTAHPKRQHPDLACVRQWLRQHGHHPPAGQPAGGAAGTPNGNKADDQTLPNGTVATDPLALSEGWRITDSHPKPRSMAHSAKRST